MAYLADVFTAEFISLQETFEAEKERDSLLDSSYLLPYLTYIKNHQKLFKIYLKNPLIFSMRKLLNSILTSSFSIVTMPRDLPMKRWFATWHTSTPLVFVGLSMTGLWTIATTTLPTLSKSFIPLFFRRGFWRLFKNHLRYLKSIAWFF